MKKIIKTTNITHKLKLLHLIKKNPKIDKFHSLNNVINEIVILKTLRSMLPPLNFQNRLVN
jgi:hypothetical protein